ncbi:kinase-like domain-containing protein [Hypoxylon sp. FL0543]|nr:kinase-like domain-containing protein [Hypoxylon sp. FL0543]
MGSNSPRGHRSAPSSYGNLSVDDIEAELRTHFAVQWRRYTFERFLGRGAFGITFRLIERLSANKTRRLAVKRSLTPQREAELQNEIDWLKTLRGAEHIVRILATRDEPESIAMTGRARRRRTMNTRPGLEDSLEGLAGPVVVLEYLENADIAQLYMRLVQHDQLLPNRILWSFFLCLIRACVALAYPPNLAEDEPNVLETVPTDGTAPSKIEHADLHAGNVMIGEIGGFEEHILVPPLKFIDFGRTREGFQGVSDNVWKISRIMINLIARQQVRISAWITEYKGFETRATEILHHGNGARYPTLDDDMRDFLARCLADEERDRPTLADLLYTAETAVRNKTAAAYPGQAGETDQEIRRLLQRFIYDADT